MESFGNILKILMLGPTPNQLSPLVVNLGVDMFLQSTPDELQLTDAQEALVFSGQSGRPL